MICSLNQRAHSEEYPLTRHRFAAVQTPPSSANKTKRSRVSATAPALPTHRFGGMKKDHVAIITKRQNACRYCAYLRAVAKLEGTTPVPDVARPSRMCNYCKDHVYHLHFELYHTQTHLASGRYMSAWFTSNREYHVDFTRDFFFIDYMIVVKGSALRDIKSHKISWQSILSVVMITKEDQKRYLIKVDKIPWSSFCKHTRIIFSLLLYSCPPRDMAIMLLDSKSESSKMLCKTTLPLWWQRSGCVSLTSTFLLHMLPAYQEGFDLSLEFSEWPLSLMIALQSKPVVDDGLLSVLENGY